MYNSIHITTTCLHETIPVKVELCSILVTFVVHVNEMRYIGITEICDAATMQLPVIIELFLQQIALVRPYLHQAMELTIA